MSDFIVKSVLIPTTVAIAVTITTGQIKFLLNGGLHSCMVTIIHFRIITASVKFLSDFSILTDFMPKDFMPFNSIIRIFC